MRFLILRPSLRIIFFFPLRSIWNKSNHKITFIDWSIFVPSWQGSSSQKLLCMRISETLIILVLDCSKGIKKCKENQLTLIYTLFTMFSLFSGSLGIKSPPPFFFFLSDLICVQTWSQWISEHIGFLPPFWLLTTTAIVTSLLPASQHLSHQSYL